MAKIVQVLTRPSEEYDLEQQKHKSEILMQL